MRYLAHTAHWQFLGLVVAFLAWIITMITAGLNEWRLWHVADESVITSGVAWVGIWRACFYSHVLPRIENCQSIGLADAFVPVEISVAQVLMVVAVVSGLAGNVSAAAAMRMVYFSLENRGNVRLVFVLAGTLYLLTGTFSLVPLVWNMHSVLANRTIDFPPEFYFPPAPVSQRVGSAVAIGLSASILMFVSGLLFLSYRYVRHPLRSEAPRHSDLQLHGARTVTTMTHKADASSRANQGRENPAFLSEDVS